MFGSILYLSNIFNGFVDFILPPSCLCCDSPIESIMVKGSVESSAVKFICPKCYGKLERFDIPHPWRDEMISQGNIDNSISVFWFREGNQIQTLMHEMKYGRMKSVGRLFGRELGHKIVIMNGVKWDYVIPVPLHRSRLRDRTYNQSEFIAESAAKITGAVALKDGIIRTRYTGTQTKLNKQQRRENVKDAFSVNPKYKDNFRGKNIIIADDVITTGATILECAKTLKSAGAAKVWVCSAAYAELKISD